MTDVKTRDSGAGFLNGWRGGMSGVEIVCDAHAFSSLVCSGFNAMDSRFKVVDAGFNSIDNRLGLIRPDRLKHHADIGAGK
ncbi:MAG: hypothetical protein LBB08_01505 [Rickettsiales bacterium]|jgi:hypothetical protein|nr:hypothetical protein [Rickettsiales bacterium]